MRPYGEILEGYVEDVLGGRIIACRDTIGACDRHLWDLSRQGTEGFRWRFSEEHAAHACRVIETLPHVKGRWAQRDPDDPTAHLIRLEPWQIFVVGSIFGWVDDSDLRRFLRASVYVARKNAKSTLAAGIGLVGFAADGEIGAEVLSGATTEKQAWEVFGPARLMAEQTPAMLDDCRVVVNKSSLTKRTEGAKFQTVIGNPGDGASPHMAIIDEYHEHQTSAQYDTMASGMGARSQPLLLVISTAGDSIEGPCFDDFTLCAELLEGSVQDDRHFAMIFRADAEDDWTSDEAMAKANPNLGVSVSVDYLEDRRRQAVRDSRKQGNYKTKHLMIWVTARDAYYNLREWTDSARPELGLGAMRHRRCLVGLDLASKIDLAAVSFVFPPEDDDPRQVWHTCQRLYVPEWCFEEADRDHYRKWLAEGWLIKTSGNMIDLGRIRDDLLELRSELEITGVGYDPHQATLFVQELSAEGVPCVEVANTTLGLSEPMKETQALLRANRLTNDGNEAMTWCVGNVVAKEDAKDNVFPRKLKREKKIDGAVAMMIAFALAGQEVEAGSVYDTRGLVTL